MLASDCGKNERSIVTVFMERLQRILERLLENVVLSFLILSQREICDQRSFSREHILLACVSHVLDKVVLQSLALYILLDSLETSGNDPAVHVCEA